jgi:hypothetical protein
MDFGPIDADGFSLYRYLYVSAFLVALRFRRQRQRDASGNRFNAGTH